MNRRWSYVIAGLLLLLVGGAVYSYVAITGMYRAMDSSRQSQADIMAVALKVLPADFTSSADLKVENVRNMNSSVSTDFGDSAYSQAMTFSIPSNNQDSQEFEVDIVSRLDTLPEGSEDSVGKISYADKQYLVTASSTDAEGLLTVNIYELVQK